MDFITLSSQVISFIRNNNPQKTRASWVKWREFVEQVYEFDMDSSKIKFSINHGKGSFRKNIKSIEDAVELITNQPKEEQTKVIQLVKLYFALEAAEKEQLNINYQEGVWQKLKASLPVSDEEEQTISTQITQWQEANEDKSFFTPINIPASLIPINLDFFLRWALLWLYKTGRLEEFAKNTLGFEDDFALFLIGHFLVITLTVFLFSLIRGRVIKNRTTKLFRELNIKRLKLKVQNSAWNYTLVFLYVVTGIFIFSSLPEANMPLIAASIVGVFHGIYLLVILALFSKRTPQSKEVLTQLEALKDKNLDRDLTHEENDEEIINLEVKLRSSNEQMEAFVLEAALFGALAFSGFLSVIASDVFSISSIEAFSSKIAELFKGLVFFDTGGSGEVLKHLLSKEGLLSLMCYETLFCSIFFLSVIASRLRFNDLTDFVDRSLQLSKNINEREEELVKNNLDGTGSKVKNLSKKIRQHLRLGNLKHDEIGPIMEYMRFFRTLGISTFFIIIITGGLFISVELSIIMFFISVLSLFYFKINKVLWTLKSFNIRMQEFYFTIDKSVHWISWSIIIIAVTMRSLQASGAKFVMLFGFSLLFLHYLFSLFIPDTVDATTGNDFESNKGFQKLLKKLLKIGLAVFFLGFMFKAMHWPGASLGLIIGLSLLSLYHFGIPKKTGSKWMNILFSFTLGLWFVAVLFKYQHWAGSPLLFWTVLPLIVIMGIATILKRKELSTSLKRTTYILLAITIVTQTSFGLYAMQNLTLNYDKYEKHKAHEALRYPLFTSVEDGGYANPTTQAERDSLQVSAERFTAHLLNNQDYADHLNGEAGNMFHFSEDKEVLREAIKWVERSIEIEKDYYNMDTYLHLLDKLEDWEKAEKIAIESIEIAKKEGHDAEFAQNVLEYSRKELAKQNLSSEVSD